jgi:hypothetical protein
MEFKRAVSAKYELSELVVAIRLHAAVAESTEASSTLLEMLRRPSLANCVNRIRSTFSWLATSGESLPGVDVSIAKQICARFSEGLTDVAGAANRFTFKIDAFSYPEQASSAHDLELAASGLLPEFSLASQRPVGKP